MKEPIAFITNIFYITLGIILFPNPLFIPFIGLGMTSALYHGTKEKKWQKADVRWMYFTMNSLIVYHIWIMSDVSLFYAYFFAIGLTLWMWKNLDDYSSTYTIAWQITLLSLLAIGNGYSLIFLPLFILAFTCNVPFLGRYHITEGWKFIYVDIFHGFWHLFTAMGFYFLIYQ